MAAKERRSRVEPSIYVRKDAQGKPVHEIVFRDSDGRQRWRTVEGGLKAARRALAEAKADSTRGVRVAANPRLTFNQAADAWRAERVVRLRPTTQAGYDYHLERLRGRFGKRRMTDITADDLARFVRDEQAQGRKGWTIKGSLTVFNGVHRHACRHLGLATENPSKLLDSVERPGTADEKAKRVLTDDELARLLANVGDEYRLLFDLAAQTGARLSETLGLVWDNIDLKDETVTFTHQLDRGGHRVPLKTKRSRRCLEVPSDLVSRLRTHKFASAHSGRHDLVFVSRAGTPLSQQNIGQRVLRRAVKAAGLGAVERNGEVVEPAPTFHSLRHTHASRLIAAGWDLEEVSARLGHADVGTTQRAYVHAYDAARRSDDRRARLAALYTSEPRRNAVT